MSLVSLSRLQPTRFLYLLPQQPIHPAASLYFQPHFHEPQCTVKQGESQSTTSFTQTTHRTVTSSWGPKGRVRINNTTRGERYTRDIWVWIVHVA
jgi:hypothetical protein